LSLIHMGVGDHSIWDRDLRRELFRETSNLTRNGRKFSAGSAFLRAAPHTSSPLHSAPELFRRNGPPPSLRAFFPGQVLFPTHRSPPYFDTAWLGLY